METRLARTAEDLAAVLAMMADFNAHERIPFDAATFAPRLQRLASSDGEPVLGGALLFTEGGAAAGYSIVTFGYDLEYGGRDAFLTELWIVQHQRGRGLGKIALAAAEAYAKEQGAHALHLLVRFDNQEARGLYERSGYETEPRAVMTKRLG